MKQTALATTALGLVNLNPLTSRGATIAPTDKINVAIIGCKNMGFGILKHHLSYADANCVAMCDVDSRVLNERADEIRKTFNQSPKLYKDFRKMLEQKDIDAVIVGTPDHWHCLAAVYSLQAGKHVYVEKPMANTIAECNIMVKAANYYKKVVQVGQQQRSGAIFQKSMEFIKTGKIGKLRKVNIWANGMEYGIAFVCDDATIVADRTKMFVYPEWDEKGKKPGQRNLNSLMERTHTGNMSVTFWIASNRDKKMHVLQKLAVSLPCMFTSLT